MSTLQKNPNVWCSLHCSIWGRNSLSTAICWGNVGKCWSLLQKSCKFMQFPKVLGLSAWPTQQQWPLAFGTCAKKRMQVPSPSLPNGSHIFQKHIFKCYSPTWSIFPSHIHMFSAIPKKRKHVSRPKKTTVRDLDWKPTMDPLPSILRRFNLVCWKTLTLLCKVHT